MQKFLILLLLMTGGCSDMFIQEISPSKIQQNDLILDVRTDSEHDETALVQDHWQVPLEELDAQTFIREHNLDGSKPLYLLCRSGRRAKEAAKKFKKADFDNVIVIRGGLIEAEKAGLKLKKSP